MAAVRWRHFWILLLWFLLVLQEQCAVRHENDFAWKHAALRIECFCHAAKTRFLPAALMAGRSRPDFHLLHIYYPLAFSLSRKAFHTLR
jgi:hypothetical protein